MTQDQLLSDDETYAALLQLMRDLDLAWVAEEVELAVLAGEVEIRDAPRHISGLNREVEAPELRGIPSLEVVRTEFLPRDRVHMAVTALSRVVIHGAEMEAEIREELGAGAVVVDDDDSAEPRVIVRDRPVDPEAIERLRGLLAEVEAGG